MPTVNETYCVLVTENIDGEVTCQVVSEFATEQEANDYACDLAYDNPSWEIEVCTSDEAAQVTTD